jgi:capsular exopolysaccharide synthesis family protein
MEGEVGRMNVVAPSWLDLPQFVLEPCRVLANTIRTARGGSLRNAMVVSSLAGEGTSTVAVALGCVLARESPGEILLVDANCRAPRLHEVLQLEMQSGLIDLLRGECSIASVLKKTGVPNLLVITVGGRAGTPFDRMPLSTLESVSGELRSRWPLVIWDAPPVAISSDAMVLAPLVDGIVLVVAHGTTPGHVALESKRRLETAGGHLLGAVLNREPRGPQWWSV